MGKFFLNLLEWNYSIYVRIYFLFMLMKKVLIFVFSSLILCMVAWCTNIASDTKSSYQSDWRYLWKEINNISQYNTINAQINNERNTLIRLQVAQSHVTEEFMSGLYLHIVNQCKNTDDLHYVDKKKCIENELIAIKNLLEPQDRDYVVYNTDFYTWSDSILKIYYNSQNRSHPIFAYYIDLIKTLESNYLKIKNVSFPNQWDIRDNDFFVANMNWNLRKWSNFWEWFAISSTDNWLVISKRVKKIIEQKFGYRFLYWPYGLMGIWPVNWVITNIVEDNWNTFLYQVTSWWAGSWEYYLTVYIWKNWLWIPIWLIYCANECKIENIENQTLIDLLFLQPWNLEIEELKVKDIVRGVVEGIHYYDQLRLLTK